MNTNKFLLKNFLWLIVLSGVLLISGCNFLKEKDETELSNLYSKIEEQKNEIEELNKIIVTQKKEIDALKSISQSVLSILAEGEPDSIAISETNEE